MTDPETPNFEQIAEPLAEYADDTRRKQIAAQLRLVWNARGAADLVRIKADLSSMMGVTAAGPYVKNLDRALRTLDR